MNTIVIVLPILTLLMFDLGLALKPADFKLIAHRPLPVLAGLLGQLVMLPLIAWAVAEGFQTVDKPQNHPYLWYNSHRWG